MDNKNLTKKTRIINFKAIRAHIKIKILLRNIEHFNQLVSYLNKNVGKGSKNWTIGGNPLKSLRRSSSIERTLYIFNEDIDESLAVFIKLL